MADHMDFSLFPISLRLPWRSGRHFVSTPLLLPTSCRWQFRSSDFRQTVFLFKTSPVLHAISNITGPQLFGIRLLWKLLYENFHILFGRTFSQRFLDESRISFGSSELCQLYISTRRIASTPFRPFRMYVCSGDWRSELTYISINKAK